MDDRTMNRISAAALATVLLLVGVELFREPTLAKAALVKFLGPAKGRSLYALFMAALGAGSYAAWRAINRNELIPELREAMQVIHERRTNPRRTPNWTD